MLAIYLIDTPPRGKSGLPNIAVSIIHPFAILPRPDVAAFLFGAYSLSNPLNGPQ